MKRKTSKWLLLMIPLLLLAGCFVYVSDRYQADERALEAMSSDEVIIGKTDYGWFFDGAGNEDALIFYPGAKVQETAYAPLLHELSRKGIDVCVVDSLFDIAFFNMNGAAKVINELDYDRWYLGGHSLGGVVASLYLQKHPDAFEGLILFASYTNKQMPEGIKEIVIVGSNDGVINWEALEKGRELAYDDYEEHIIEGGNHAQFGSYGLQRGDGQAGISPQEQIRETVEIIIEAINR
jgi:hypothetical protein